MKTVSMPPGPATAASPVGHDASCRPGRHRVLEIRSGRSRCVGTIALAGKVHGRTDPRVRLQKNLAGS